MIDPISVYSNKLFFITFENLLNIKMMNEHYKSYEHLIGDLEFDRQGIIIKNDKANLIYVKLNFLI